MWRKFKTAVATSVFFVLIGVVLLGGILFFQNLSVIIEKFTDTPIETVAIFVAGAISLKLAQILRLIRARQVREKKDKKAKKADAQKKQ